jgi:hypothetical protein
MTIKVHSPERHRELVAQGFALVARLSAARRERERKEKQERSAPASTRSSPGIDASSARQYETQVVNPTATAKAIIEAGRKARGETDDAISMPTGFAAAVLAAADLARAGGPALPEPTGLAAQIIAAGEKRRKPMGDS